MIADVRREITRVPFAPFSIRTSDGHEYQVPTVDYVYITPRGDRVVVSADDGGVAILGPLHIAAVVQQHNGV